MILFSVSKMTIYHPYKITIDDLYVQIFSVKCYLFKALVSCVNKVWGFLIYLKPFALK